MSLKKLREKLDDSEKEMTFFDHIEELRSHIIRSVLAIVVFWVVAFVNKKILFDVIIFGPMQTDFWSYKQLCKLSYFINGDDSMCIKDIGFVLSNIQLTGQFTQHFFVSFVAGAIMAFPFVVWEFWRFLKPALNKKEKRYARGMVFYSSMLFFIGVLFGYYMLCPVSVNFMGSYRVSDVVSNEINLESYVSFVATLVFGAGLVFELPILIYFLAKIGLISSSMMKKYRKHSLVVNLVLSAIITPPDVSSQIMLSIPLALLYEIGILVAKRVEKDR